MNSALSAAACQVQIPHGSSTRSNVHKQVPILLLVLAVLPRVCCTYIYIYIN